MTNRHTFNQCKQTIGLLFTALFFLLGAGTIQALENDAKRNGGTTSQTNVKAKLTKQQLNQLRTTITVHKQHRQDLMAHDDVFASGVGLGPGGEPFIKLFTRKAVKRGIPEMLDGVRVHSEVSERFYALRGETCDASGDQLCTSTERWPLPVPTGVSAGHPQVTAGTIGARVTDGASVFILSNNHVIADVNQANIGDAILQPGSFDGGLNPDDAIASLTEFEHINMCTISLNLLVCDQTNTMDAAIAISTPAELGFATPTGEFGSVTGYGAPNQIIHPAFGDPDVIGDEELTELLGTAVQKYGRTTVLTSGTVDTIDVTIDVCYDQTCTQIARFDDQILVSPGTFSAGGDSGSLAVSNDSNKYPVGLVFAGSSSYSVLNRIDRVLSRFNVIIDDGSVNQPILELATTNINVPTAVAAGETTTVSVSVQNVGNVPVASATVTLQDLTQPGTVANGSQVVTNLLPGATTSVEFLWTPTTQDQHTLQATHQISGGNTTTDDTATANVNVMSSLTSGPQLQLRQLQAFTNKWTTVSLDYDYGNEMVVVCTPNYDLSANGPSMVRVKNAFGTSFEVGLGRPWLDATNADHFSATVHCMVVREGVYNLSEHGVKMEAVKLPAFTTTDNASSWQGESRTYQNPAGYSSPVVLGQVISFDDRLIPSYCGNTCELNWSVFWSRGTSRSEPASSSALYVGRHTGEDTNGRAPETLMYVVIDAGSGNMDGKDYVAALGGDSIRGMQSNPPFSYNLTGLNSVSTAIASQAAMDGGNGGWAVLYGPNAISPTQLLLAIEEDWYFDSERSHTTEQVGYIVFE